MSKEQWGHGFHSGVDAVIQGVSRMPWGRDGGFNHGFNKGYEKAALDAHDCSQWNVGFGEGFAAGLVSGRQEFAVELWALLRRFRLVAVWRRLHECQPDKGAPLEGPPF